MVCLSHPLSFNLPNNFFVKSANHEARRYIFWFHSPLTSSPLHPHILLSTLPSRLESSSSLRVRDEVSYLYQAAGSFCVFESLIAKIQAT